MATASSGSVAEGIAARAGGGGGEGGVGVDGDSASTTAATSSSPRSKHSDDDDDGDGSSSSAAAGRHQQHQHPPPEWMDEIRFLSYRTASKLRLVQKRTGLAHIDVWNMIEAFRENGLDVVNSDARVSRPVLETLVGTLYANLGKRLPPGRRGKVEQMASWLLSWLLAAVDDRTRTMKVVLVLLSSGKLVDKLRYAFSLVSDANGHLSRVKYGAFLRDAARIPRAVGEEFRPSDDGFDGPRGVVTLNVFLEALISDPGPQMSLSWLPVLHRLAAAESAIHSGIRCGSCGADGFRGLRYKSDLAKNYNLCQWCFWRGRIPPQHRDDVFKEFGASPAAAKPVNNEQQVFPEPPSSEHQLIARYAREVGSKSPQPLLQPQQQQLVYELERKNQEIMHDIERLKRSRQQRQQQPPKQVMTELEGLRQHKMQLESRLDELQSTRKDLMAELDELMKLLRVQQLPPQQQRQWQQQQQRMAAESNGFTNVAGMGIEEMGRTRQNHHQPCQQQQQQQAMGQPIYASVQKPHAKAAAAEEASTENQLPQRKPSMKMLKKSKAVIIEDEDQQEATRSGSSAARHARSASVVSLSD